MGDTSLLQGALVFLFDGPSEKKRSNSCSDDDLRSRTRMGLVLVFLFAILVRYCVSGGSHSGEATPPMYGDYEAQRHWMEITINTPINEWYFNTTDNDLLYWGLDYPPLTAYVSYAFGKVAEQTVPELVELRTSRGHESTNGKLFMRFSVMLCDVLLFLPAAYLLVTSLASTTPTVSSLSSSPSLPPSPSRRKSYTMVCLLLLLLCPALVLIDHGHFQYNNFSIGLFLLAVYLINTSGGNGGYGLDIYTLLGGACFVASVCFKQMSLYLSPPFFFYCLGRSLVQLKLPSSSSSSSSSSSAPSSSLEYASLSVICIRVLGLAVAVLLTFAVCLYPFYLDISQLQQVMHRLFPFARGLYEDKVANFWCSSHMLIKWKQLYSIEALARVSISVTVLSFLPANIDAMLRPTRARFISSLAISGLSFYLFSFQVHEKSFLLPLMPIMMLLMMAGRIKWLSWISTMAAFSMYPLLQRDGLSVQYFALQGMTLLLGWHLDSSSSDDQTEKANAGAASSTRSVRSIIDSFASNWLPALSVGGMAAIHFISAFGPDSQRYPDLKTILFTTYAFLHIVLVYICVYYYQFCVLPGVDNGALVLSLTGEGEKKKKK